MKTYSLHIWLDPQDTLPTTPGVGGGGGGWRGRGGGDGSHSANTVTDSQSRDTAL